MAHMVPTMTDKIEWYEVETSEGIVYIPCDTIKECEIDMCISGKYLSHRVINGYGVCLYAPGYLDATDWEVYVDAVEAEERMMELDEVE